MLLVLFSWVTSAIASVVLVRLVDIYLENGLKGVLKSVAGFLVTLPGIRVLVRAFTQKEVKGFMKDSFDKDASASAKVLEIPEKGVPVDDLRQELASLKCGHEKLVSEGRLFAYVYTEEGPRLQLQKEAFSMFTKLSLRGIDDEHVGVVETYLESFMHDNALNPLVFPSLRKFENEVVAMTSSMLHGDCHVVGSVTSGGTESILMAMKTYRDMARDLKPKITKPNVVAPITIHPAFEKAAHYFNLEMKHIPVNQTTFQCDVIEYERAIDSNTILLLASAPSYPQAILDPVEQLSKIALRHQLPFHVDACFGGFMLPWVEKLGNAIPLWDYRLPGVTSISADLHKYGFATKGASVVTYRHCGIRKYQFFAYSGWSGGLFASPTMAGTRPGGHLAGAWVALRAMGQDGYMNMAGKLMDTASKMKEGINKIDGLKVLGNPLMTAFGFGASDPNLNIFSVADVMEKKGLVKPYDLFIYKHNLNAQLFWDIQVEHETPLNDADLNNDVIYTVFVYKWVKENKAHSWIPMPNCVEIRQKVCNLSLIEAFSNEYKVGILLTNGSYIYSVKQEYDPSLYERLHAPAFVVSLDGNDVIIDIPDPPEVTWSGELLFDFLSEFDLEYFIKYWTKGDDSSISTPHIIIRPANMVAIRFPVERKANDAVCIRLLLQGQVDFNPGYWSTPICTTETTSFPPGKIVAMVVGCVALIVIIVGTIYLLKKKVDKFLKPIHSPIPEELRDVALGLHVDNVGNYCESEPEKVAIYHPYKMEVPHSEIEGETPYSETLDKHHYPITNNNYVTKRADNVRKNRPPSLINVSPPDDVSDDISDYVGVPSPDSGLGLRMEF